MSIKIDMQLVCETLVKEIESAQRWSAVMDAWRALLKVRRMGTELISEIEEKEPCAHGLPDTEEA